MLFSQLFSQLFLFSNYADHNNDGGWGNDTNGLSGVDAGVPASGDCDGGWQELEQRAGSSWNGHGEMASKGHTRTWGQSEYE